MAFLRRNSALFSLVCASAFMLDAAHAADITSAYTDTGIGSIHFSGMVEEGDSKKFIEVYEEPPIRKPDLVCTELLISVLKLSKTRTRTMLMPGLLP